jgi:hypothetical protein
VEPGTELAAVPESAVVVVDVDASAVVGVSRATTCDELPAPHAASARAKPVNSVAVTSLGVFISIPPLT